MELWLPSRGCILPTPQSSAEHSNGLQEVDVVRADVVLGHVDDGAHEGGLSVVVGGYLRNGASQLSHLHVPLVLPLETSEEDLATQICTT